MEIPSDLKYTPTHEWARKEEDGIMTVGITDKAQQLLGELVFVELPTVGEEVKRGGEVAVVESVKAASDVYAPVSGTITCVNESLSETPQLVNEKPYKEGWIFRLKPEKESELNELLNAKGYKNQIEAT